MMDHGLGFGSEIDIFEFMPWWKSEDGFLSHSGMIWAYGKATATNPEPHAHGNYTLGNDGYGPKEIRYPDADTKFHTYGLYWDKERLVFFIDSKPVFRVKDAQHVGNVPEYILLNCAMSLNGWGKGPNKKDPTRAQIDAGLPTSMDID